MGRRMEINKKILVTGGLGFIGTNLVKELLKYNNTIYVLDNLSSGDLENKMEGVTYIIDDTKNLNKLFKDFNFDLVFHLGEYSRIVPSFKEIKKIFNSNILGSFTLLELCKANNVPIVYASSSTRLSEEGENHSPYSYFKSTITKLIKNYGDWYGLKYSICYFYNVYGPYQDAGHDGWETVISIFEKQLKDKKPLTICGDGTQRRDFTYVGDIIEGLILASQKLKNEEYQLGSGKDYSILEVAKMFGGEIKYLQPRPGDRKKGLANTEKTKQKLGWYPKMNLKTWINSIK